MHIILLLVFPIKALPITQVHHFRDEKQDPNSTPNESDRHTKDPFGKRMPDGPIFGSITDANTSDTEAAASAD